MANEREFVELFGRPLRRDEIIMIRDNDPQLVSFTMDQYMQDADQFLTEPAWERLGSYIAGNNCLRDLDLYACGLDDSKTAALFGGLKKSDSLREVVLEWNTFGPGGMNSMVPFLKSSPNLALLSFAENGSVNTECLDQVVESLDGGAIERLNFSACNIESLAALGRFTLPKLRELYLSDNKITDIPAQALTDYTQLAHLVLENNKIGGGGFLAISNLLRREDSSLKVLYAGSTGMGDAGAELIAESLKGNTMLSTLDVSKNGMGDTGAELIAESLMENDKLERLDVSDNDFGRRGLMAYLTLLNDASSMDRTGNSNHTLRWLDFSPVCDKVTAMAEHIKDALKINCGNRESPAAAGRDKVLKTLLDRKKRMALSHLQGVEHSSDHYLFSGIDPILLPNVLGLAVESGSQSELYQMLATIAPDLASLIDRKAMLKEALANAEARMAAIAAEHAKLDAESAKLDTMSSRVKSRLMSMEAEEGRMCQLPEKKRDDEDDRAGGEEYGEEETANDGDATAERDADGEASDDGVDLGETGASANDDGVEERGSAEEFQKLMDQCGGNEDMFLQLVQKENQKDLAQFQKDIGARKEQFAKNMETYATNAAVFAMEHKRAAGGESELAECFNARESNLKRIADYEKKRDSLGGNEGDPVYAGARKSFEDGIAQCQSDLSNANKKIEAELRGNKRRCTGMKAGDSTPDAAKGAAAVVINEYLAPEKLNLLASAALAVLSRRNISGKNGSASFIDEDKTQAMPDTEEGTRMQAQMFFDALDSDATLRATLRDAWDQNVLEMEGSDPPPFPATSDSMLVKRVASSRYPVPLLVGLSSWCSSANVDGLLTQTRAGNWKVCGAAGTNGSTTTAQITWRGDGDGDSAVKRILYFWCPTGAMKDEFQAAIDALPRQQELFVCRDLHSAGSVVMQYILSTRPDLVQTMRSYAQSRDGNAVPRGKNDFCFNLGRKISCPNLIRERDALIPVVDFTDDAASKEAIEGVLERLGQAGGDVKKRICVGDGRYIFVSVDEEDRVGLLWDWLRQAQIDERHKLEKNARVCEKNREKRDAEHQRKADQERANHRDAVQNGEVNGEFETFYEWFRFGCNHEGVRDADELLNDPDQLGAVIHATMLSPFDERWEKKKDDPHKGAPALICNGASDQTVRGRAGHKVRNPEDGKSWGSTNVVGCLDHISGHQKYPIRKGTKMYAHIILPCNKAYGACCQFKVKGRTGGVTIWPDCKQFVCIHQEVVVADIIAELAFESNVFDEETKVTVVWMNGKEVDIDGKDEQFVFTKHAIDHPDAPLRSTK